MKCNFYTTRYWLSLRDLMYLSRDNPSYNGWDYGSTLCGLLVTYEWMDYISGTDTDLKRMGSYLPIFEKKETSAHVFYWEESEIAHKLYVLLKERFINEFVCDISFELPVIDDRIWNNYAYFGLTLDQITELRHACWDFFDKFMTILKMTYDRYALILKTYEDNKADLLNKVESLTRFNDTPQDTGEFSDDEHTTHITSTKNDFDTLMGRIDEIDRKYRNVLADWTREFESLFIHEESL